jgi:transcriptional regulator of aromatic amino acid metabolism
MYLEDGKRVPETLDTLGEKRQWLLERLETYEKEIIEHVQAEYLKGHSARHLARRAGVTHPTILKWLRGATVSERNGPDGNEP